MSQSCESPPNGDDPPVESPSLGMLGKLILLPALVVVSLVLMVVVIGWLTLSPGDVDSMVDALKKGGNRRWRAAVNLAGVLREPGGAGLKRDPVLAARLTEILEREIESGGTREDEITLRMYLCRALGEFHLGEPLPVLIEAATTERDPREVDVRRSAIEAIAVLASNLGPSRLRSRAELIAALREASQDTRAPLRSAAAFTLGVIGGSEAETELAALLSDAHPDVRYNAATGLARHGDVKAVDVLLEMLDPSETAGVDVEKQEPARDFKRAMILVNALRAAGQLAAANPSVDWSRLERAIEGLARAEAAGAVRVEAADVLDRLRTRGGKADADTP